VHPKAAKADEANLLKFTLKWFDSKDFGIASPQALKKWLSS
jgi:hypothetical protein